MAYCYFIISERAATRLFFGGGAFLCLSFEMVSRSPSLAGDAMLMDLYLMLTGSLCTAVAAACRVQTTCLHPFQVVCKVWAPDLRCIGMGAQGTGDLIRNWDRVLFTVIGCGLLYRRYVGDLCRKHASESGTVRWFVTCVYRVRAVFGGLLVFLRDWRPVNW